VLIFRILLYVNNRTGNCSKFLYWCVVLTRRLPRKQVYSYTYVRDIFASNLGMFTGYDVKRSSCFYFDFRECRHSTTKHGPNFSPQSFSYLLVKTIFPHSSSKFTSFILVACFRQRALYSLWQLP